MFALAVLSAAPGPAGVVPGFDDGALAAQTRSPIAERTPLVLVPGWAEEGQDLEPLKALFVDAGWSAADIAIVEFADAEGSNIDHAHELEAVVTALRASSGADRVDVVAHSMGGLATRYYLQNGGAQTVRRVAFMATPHRGTYVAYLAWGEGGEEMHPGSVFLLDLQRFRAVPEDVEAITVRTKVDLHIIPPESATLVGVPNIEVCCPSHIGILTHPDAFEALERFFLREP
ncbi:MAG TPA: alpha/beta fold hydrolase [Longimicrobiales bacterium]|nr:alpha/beta fold hydrolase [Longimicrobiales bacterium]